jgi:transcriptional regulator with XRE-family HTH domain
MPATATKKLNPEIQAARNALRRKGWSQAQVAARLGISRIHVCYVLNGRRESRRVINAILHLPENPTPA